MNKRLDAVKYICGQFGVTLLHGFGSRAAEVRDWPEEQLEKLPAGPSDADIGVKGFPERKGRWFKSNLFGSVCHF